MQETQPTILGIKIAYDNQSILSLFLFFSFLTGTNDQSNTQESSPVHHFQGIVCGRSFQSYYLLSF